jgi:AraC family transcriptional regulator
VQSACVTGRACGRLGFIVRVAYRYIRPLTVVYARSIGPHAASSAEAWLQMNAWLDRRQMRRRIKQGYGFLRDNPRLTARELLRYDACVPAIAGLDADAAAGIGRQTLQGGAYAVQTHVGSYAEVGALYSRLHREIVPKRGLTVDYDRPFLAIYLNDPAVTREVHRRTELCVPVLPVRMPISSNDEDVDVEAHAAACAGSGRVPA